MFEIKTYIRFLTCLEASDSVKYNLLMTFDYFRKVDKPNINNRSNEILKIC